MKLFRFELNEYFNKLIKSVDGYNCLKYRNNKRNIDGSCNWFRSVFGIFCSTDLKITYPLTKEQIANKTMTIKQYHFNKLGCCRIPYCKVKCGIEILGLKPNKQADGKYCKNYLSFF